MNSKQFIRVKILIAIAVSALFIWLMTRVLEKVKTIAPRVVCGTNLARLDDALRQYASDYDGRLHYQYWIKRGHYGMNPNAEPNSPGDIVLLLETKAGWNQFGGPEILTTENHFGEGCSVLFNSGRVEWIKAKDIGKLKWN